MRPGAGGRRPPGPCGAVLPRPGPGGGGSRILLALSPTPPPCGRCHSPVPGPWGPAAVITLGAVPLGSSNRDLLTSGSPVEGAVLAGGAVLAAAAGSSGPTSHTRVTTTGVDELAWAARSCRGLVRAGGKGRDQRWDTGQDLAGPDTAQVATPEPSKSRQNRPPRHFRLKPPAALGCLPGASACFGWPFRGWTPVSHRPPPALAPLCPRGHCPRSPSASSLLLLLPVDPLGTLTAPALTSGRSLASKCHPPDNRNHCPLHPTPPPPGAPV